VTRFAGDLAAAGGSGLITPDLTPEEAGEWLRASDDHDLDRIFLIAPSSTAERIEMIGKLCRGFVYVVSLMGITGARDQVSGMASSLVGRARGLTDLPLAVGIGVRNGNQAAEVASFADGVIVGSAFVQRLLEAPDLTSGVQGVSQLTADLSAGVRRPARAVR
jgi:tryptophan synthase alpha chain